MAEAVAVVVGVGEIDGGGSYENGRKLTDMRRRRYIYPRGDLSVVKKDASCRSLTTTECIPLSLKVDFGAVPGREGS